MSKQKKTYTQAYATLRLAAEDLDPAEITRILEHYELAEGAVDSWCTFAFALTGKGPYPKAQFYAFAEAVRRYLVAIEGSPDATSECRWLS